MFDSRYCWCRCSSDPVVEVDIEFVGIVSFVVWLSSDVVTFFVVHRAVVVDVFRVFGVVDPLFDLTLFL